MCKTNWTINSQKSSNVDDIPVRNIKSLLFDTLFRSDKNPFYAAYQQIRENFCPTCQKFLEISEQDCEKIQQCCSIFIISAFTGDLGETYSNILDVLNDSIENEISGSIKIFKENQQEVRQGIVNQS